MKIDEFKKELEKLGIILTPEKEKKLDTYYTMLIDYNEKINLTAITKKEEVYLKHFFDSLTLIKAINLNENLNICDVGTGAGFPGLVLKIVFPNLNITLVDSLEKRIKFLNEVITNLNLTNIICINKRIEELKNDEQFDYVVSRAVAKTSVLLELVSRLPKVNGYVVLMKANLQEEIKEAKNALNLLNYKIENIINFNLPIENSTRNLLILKKINHTNNKYPRMFKKIKEKSL